MIAFTIPCKPVAKARPRMGRSRVYTPAKTADFERAVALIGKPYFSQPLEGPIKLSIAFNFAPPKSLSKVKQRLRLGHYHVQKPDLSNLVKGIEDGLNGIAWIDDCQIAVLETKKIWSGADQIHVWIEEAGIQLAEPEATGSSR